MKGDKKSGLSSLQQLIAIIVLLCVGMPIFAVIVSNTLDSDYNYAMGLSDSLWVILLDDKFQKMQIEGELKDGKYADVLRTYNELVDATFNGSNITLSMVRSYNKALKESGFSDYRLYQISYGITRSYGLADGIKCRKYYYYVKDLYNNKIISVEEYNAFSKMYEEKEHDKEKVTTFIEYAEEFIRRVTGKEATAIFLTFTEKNID